MSEAALRRLLPLAIVAAVLVAFAPAFGAEFLHFDDDRNITENPHFRGLGGEQLEWMLTTCWMGPYQPLAWLSLAVDHALFGLDPAAFHATNVVLHALGALALYALAAARPRLVRCPEPARTGVRSARRWRRWSSPSTRCASSRSCGSPSGATCCRECSRSSRPGPGRALHRPWSASDSGRRAPPWRRPAPRRRWPSSGGAWTARTPLGCISRDRAGPGSRSASSRSRRRRRPRRARAGTTWRSRSPSSRCSPKASPSCCPWPCVYWTSGRSGAGFRRVWCSRSCPSSRSRPLSPCWPCGARRARSARSSPGRTTGCSSACCRPATASPTTPRARSSRSASPRSTSCPRRSGSWTRGSRRPCSPSWR